LVKQFFIFFKMIFFVPFFSLSCVTSSFHCGELILQPSLPLMLMYSIIF